MGARAYLTSSSLVGARVLWELELEFGGSSSSVGLRVQWELWAVSLTHTHNGSGSRTILKATLWELEFCGSTSSVGARVQWEHEFSGSLGCVSYTHTQWIWFTYYSSSS